MTGPDLVSSSFLLSPLHCVCVRVCVRVCVQNLMERLDSVQASSATGQIHFQDLLEKLENEESGGEGWIPPYMRMRELGIK
mmetsp:Transcript_7593/g.19472  ORF Transcript_7593/g.19472 Transcript_7593/m.19472 type:complete len:81 (-) Transcript_7593:657-899(-)